MRENLYQRKEFKRMLDRYSAGICTPEEKKLVEKWFESIGSGNHLLIDEVQHQQIESRLWKKIGGKASVRGLGSRIWRRIAATAAILALSASTIFLIRGSDTENVVTPVASLTSADYPMLASNEGTVPKTVVLEDGSTVRLQPNSYLAYSHFKPEKREVKLIGAAFFEVSHDAHRPFLVYSKDVITKVLGTSFFIDALQQDAEVTVAVRTGRVSVSRPSASIDANHTDPGEVILTPNQKAIFDLNQNKLTTTLTDNPQPLAHSGEPLAVMTFDEEHLPVIIHRLEEAYGVSISFDEEVMKSCVLTTVFTNETLYDRLKIICKAINGTFETKGTSIILQSHGCKN